MIPSGTLEKVQSAAFPPMLAAAAVHVRTLPTRPMDFARCAVPSLAACVDLLVREANRQERRVRLDVQRAANTGGEVGGLSPRAKAKEVPLDDVPEMLLAPPPPTGGGREKGKGAAEEAAPAPPPREPTPFELLLRSTYSSDELLRVAAESWRAEGPPPPPKGGPPGGPRGDGKSESCAVS